jgi:iron-sulfur cluster assembly protein
MNFKISKTGNAIVDYLTVSPEAITQIKKLLSKRTEPCEGIRVSVRTRGCSGLSYTIEFAIADKNISKYDDVILCHDNDKEIQIFISTFQNFKTFNF